jgi:hypothetical protein
MFSYKTNYVVKNIRILLSKTNDSVNGCIYVSTIVQRNATFVPFKAQDFYWLTILFIIKIKIDHFLVFEAFWWEKVCVCVFSCEIVVIMRCAERKGRNRNDAVATCNMNFSW